MKYQVMYAAYPSGPFFEYDLEQIRQKVASGEIKPDTMVRQHPDGPWMPVGEVLSPATISQQNSHFASRASERYRDGYLVARAIAGLGGFIKLVAIALAILIIVAGFIFGSQTNSSIGFLGIIVAVLTGISFHIVGIILSAQGQMLKASLDEAIHTSPFLNDQQKAAAMSL